MRVIVTKDMFEHIGVKKMAEYGASEYDMRYAKEIVLKMSEWERKKLADFTKMMVDCAAVKPALRGAKAALSNCEFFTKTLSGDDTVKPRSLEAFELQLRRWLMESGKRNEAESRPAGVRLYRRDEDAGVWLVYHVTSCKFKPAEKQHRGGIIPASVTLGLAHRLNGKNAGGHLSFGWERVMGKTPEEGLAVQGYLIETPELRADYDERAKKFMDWSGKIGKQMLATGEATDNCDGNKKKRRNDEDHSMYYWRSQTNSIRLDKGGEPTRVVIDLFHESKEGRAEETTVDRLYWFNAMKNLEDDESELANAETEEAQAVPMPEIPIHPSLVVFDLKRHLRLRLDVGQLKEHTYDAHLGDKLILPEDSRNLVEMLLAHKGQFRDIVKGKSGGAIILCAGVPGTGKTLTAEVYAEVMARPLYTVQASQLGTDPEELEDELLKTFARAARWGAIMLIDEADVYVHARGDDLQQNAIVGVFLRVLEYYKGVLFMTTNRSDLVDDAIASRCIARIDYKAPIPEDQCRIWTVLAKTAGVEIKQEVINAVVKRYPDLTGRDVKNLLKLAKLVSDSRECDITLDVIRFVKRFKPTVGTAAEVRDEEPVRLPPPPGERGEEPEAAAPAPLKVLGLDVVEASGWKDAVTEVFDDGAPHGAAETKDAARKVKPDIHPNVVTSFVVSLVKSGQLERLQSGLYRRPEAAEAKAG